MHGFYFYKSDGAQPNDQYSMRPSLYIKDTPLHLISLKSNLAKLVLEVEYRGAQKKVYSCEYEKHRV